ncbi:DNA polymerase III subunit alpha, partial [Candidatus Peregrinibacteria bacterium]|nr:DNA polymerase III subunit alpha [Candidatus Peregrinibacteria bacterium]
VHAAGVVIAPTELTDFTPLQRETGSGENVITQYEMHAVEEAGLVKMDFLGIRNLSILGNAVHLVKQTKDIDVDINDLPFDDKKTFELLAKGQTMGMFQLGGSGMTRYLVELKPTKVTDIMAMVALFRPGPMEAIPEFIERKHNPEKIEYLDPRMKKFLEDSYGIITYQDDILYISIEIAGYNWEEADKLRKAMGKKIPAEMAAQKDKFLKGCVEHGNLSPEKADTLWKLIEPFAAYGFGRAHAASYGIVAFQTAYMKAHFPAEFMAALMSAEADDMEKISHAVDECESMGIKVLPPDVNESFADFTVVNDETIRFGLSAIKNIGSHIVEEIILERKKDGKFSDISSFLERVKDKDLNKKSIDSFTKSGSLDSLGKRHTLFQNIEKLIAFAKESHLASSRNQSSLFGDASGKSAKLQLDEAPEDDEQSLHWEKELLGLYISGHPLDKYKKALSSGSRQIDSLKPGIGKITIFALIKEAKEITTKKGDLMSFMTLEDLTGTIEAIVFPKTYKDIKEMIQSGQLAEVTGKTDERNGNTQIICETIKPLSIDAIEQAKKTNPALTKDAGSQIQVSRLDLFVDPKMPPNQLAQIKEILYNAQGTTPVVLHINGTKKMRLPIAINAENGLTQELENIMGKESVKLVMH